EEAKLGVLTAALLASLVAWGVFRVVRRLPTEVRARQLAGTAEELLDLSEDVDPERDHIRGSEHGFVTLVEYGDYQCPYCGVAEDVASADASGVAGTPSFFINGKRHAGAYDIATLTAAVNVARTRVRLLGSGARAPTSQQVG